MRGYLKKRVRVLFSIIMGIEFFLFFSPISSIAGDLNCMEYAIDALVTNGQPVENETYIGKVVQYFPEKGHAVVLVSNSRLRKGDIIHFKGNVTDFIHEIENMLIGRKRVKKAKEGQTVFIIVHQPVETGDQVFLSIPKPSRSRSALYGLAAVIMGGASVGAIYVSPKAGNGEEPPLPEPPSGDYKFEAKSLFKLATDPRTIGLGDAFVAVADDSNAVFYNPAGLSQIEEISTSLAFFRPFSEIDNIFYLSGSLAIPTKFGSFGIGGLFFNNKKIEAFIPENSSRDETFTDKETVFLLSYALGISDKFRIGASLKYIDQDISRFSEGYVDCDLGFIVKPLKFFNVGISLQNFIQFFSSDRKYNFYNPLVPAVKVGFGYRFSDNWIISLQNDFYKDEKSIARLGLEYDNDNIQFRLGGNSHNGGVFAIGGGVKISTFRLNYSFVWNNKFGNTHGISLMVIY